ncbi:MAG: response regulator [Ferruginibacter sp.]
MAIEELGHDVICIAIEDGLKMIESWKQEGEQLPDIMFIDINLPPKSGWDILHATRQHHLFNSIPVIMFSTSSNDIDIERAKHEGALFLFTKPDRFQDLKACLEIIYLHIAGNALDTLKEKSCPWFHFV